MVAKRALALETKMVFAMCKACFLRLLVSTSFLLLVVRHLLLVAMHLLLVASCNA